MRFIDINALSKKEPEGGMIKLYVDLSSIGVIGLQEPAEENDHWQVAVSTPAGFKGLKCIDRKEAEEIIEHLIALVEEARTVPIRAQHAMLTDYLEKLRSW